MEIGDDGARWVAGGPGAVPGRSELSALQAQDGKKVVVEADIPAVAISDPALHALGIPLIYQAKVLELANRFDLSPSLIEALVWQESRWRHGAISSAGARGLAQLMPGTARYLGVDADDALQNLEGGARYLREQLDTFDGDLEKALAAYNAGPGRVIAAGGVPNIRETRLYVAAIMGRLSDHSRKEYQ
ncbi:lytic transglycosylase domain-containing protein [Parerythrobacter aestuarii]|uniref:lytic transglycosylase domain-containing protein n=1 Tax=Parerythrobacter aestuarii TaxID=3020909 RepID=UPI0024DE079E|nr:lytic transglycosylase domain-containing protein [Parerythrobacter aestuarii]